MKPREMIGCLAPTRCPCCGGSSFSDGPLSLGGEYRCLDCDADVVGPLLTEAPLSTAAKVIYLDERPGRFEPVPNQVMELFFDDAEGAP